MMLFLVFKIGRDRYALRTDQVMEVLPLVEWKTLPAAPPGVAGIFNYHGAPVPLVDVGELATRRPSARKMSTRIMVVKYTARGGETHPLGLLVEEATTTLRRAPEEFAEPGVEVENAPYLGPVTTDERGIVQWIKLDQLLPESVQEILFHQPLEQF